LSRYIKMPNGSKILVGGTDKKPEMSEAEAKKAAADKDKSSGKKSPSTDKSNGTGGDD